MTLVHCFFLQTLLLENHFIVRMFSLVVVRLMWLVIDYQFTMTGSFIIIIFYFSILVVCILDVLKHHVGAEVSVIDIYAILIYFILKGKKSASVLFPRMQTLCGCNLSI
jgi:hypothetical protein